MLAKKTEDAAVKLEWSAWVRGISREPRGSWFVRDDNALRALPTKVGGVYEIAHGADGPTNVVYCGRALATEAGGGTTLRQRIYSGYALNGSHIEPKLRAALEGGSDVYFRWAILLDRKTIETAESDLIYAGTYPWNTVRVKAGFLRKLDDLVAGDETKRRWALAHLQKPLPEKPETPAEPPAPRRSARLASKKAAETAESDKPTTTP